MLVSVLINNYNYARYLEQTIYSVLEQSYSNIEIVIIDDGSKDNSAEILKKFANKYQNIKIKIKENGGQLSCFNAGFSLSTGEIICFLDADDEFNSNYIEKIVSVYKQNPSCDFLFSAMKQFDQSHDIIMQPFRTVLTDLGYTAFLTYYKHSWVGERTSAISLRRSLGNKIFPLAMEDDWRIRADDCLIWMSSIAGGRKFYLAEALVKYRIHGNNLFFGKKEDVCDKYRRKVQVARFFGQVNLNYPQFEQVSPGKRFRLLLLEAMTGEKNDILLNDYANCMKMYTNRFSLKEQKLLRKIRRDARKYVQG